MCVVYLDRVSVYTLNSYMNLMYTQTPGLNIRHTHTHTVLIRLLDCNIKQNLVSVILDHSPVYRVTVPYAACVQLYPPEDEHLRLETCKGD